jgi:protein SCO1/2
MVRRCLIALPVALGAGVGALGFGTNGFRIFTSEGVRRDAVARAPRDLPDVALEDQDGRRFRLAELRGRVVLMEFIYTRCATICLALGATFQQLRERIARAHPGAGVQLLTVSFDPAYDDPPRLAAFAERHGGAGPDWCFARPLDDRGLAALLAACGIVVRPDRYGGFDHNAAIHLIDRAGRLARVLGPVAIDQAMTELGRHLA